MSDVESRSVKARARGPTSALAGDEHGLDLARATLGRQGTGPSQNEQIDVGGEAPDDKARRGSVPSAHDRQQRSEMHWRNQWSRYSRSGPKL
jgi:hypothetical protein